MKFFVFAVAVASMVACSTAESEILKKARTIQEGIMTSKGNLDSTLDVTIKELNTKLTTMSADSLFMADSANAAQFSEVQSRVARLGELKSKLADWTSNMKALPSVEDLAKGVENPFGAEAKDEDILKSMETTQAEFNDLKSAIETEMQ